MMTAKEVKEYLQEIYYLDRRIKRLQAMREEIRADLYSVKSTTDYNRDKVQSSVQGDTMLRLIAKVDMIERTILEEMDELIDRKDAIRRQIELVSDQTARDILYQRYVSLYSWEQIAVNLGYSRRHVIRLHGHALALFGKDVLECHP